ncbi:MAG: mechanosensitive ion channel family protein [Deltaproteobacteria bacterium]|nr:mechanosensitive ion channel family protein [Deltaproteobacteria bacterium]
MGAVRLKNLSSRLGIAILASVLMILKARLLAPIFAFGWETFPSIIDAVVETFFYITVGWLSSGLLDFFIWGGMEMKTGRPVPKLLKDIVTGIIFVAIILTILARVFSVPIAGLVAGSSVMAAIIGLAVTLMISDVFSGVALSVEGAYCVGDWLEIEMKTKTAGYITGKMVEINWRATRLHTHAGEVVVVPNSEIARMRFINFSIPHRHYRAEVLVHLSHTIPADRVKRVLGAALKATSDVMTDQPSEITLLRFDPRGVTWGIRFWVGDYSLNSRVMNQLHENVLNYLQVAGIDLSYNRIDQRIVTSGMEELKKKPLKTGLIKRIELFEVVDKKHLELMADSMREHFYAPQQMIFSQNQEGSSLFIVAEGLVNILIAEENGQNKLLSHIEPGKYFGEMSLLTGQPRTASAQAETEVICYEITKETISAIINDEPAVLQKLSKVMGERQIGLNRISESYEIHSLENEKEKHSNWLLQTMQIFFGIKHG